MDPVERRDQNWILLRARIGSHGEGPKSDPSGRDQNRIIKQVGRRDKGKSVSNIAGVADLTGKNALRKKSQDATVR